MGAEQFGHAPTDHLVVVDQEHRRHRALASVPVASAASAVRIGGSVTPRGTHHVSRVPGPTGRGATPDVAADRARPGGQVGQAAARDRAGDADPVVDDLDREGRVGGDGHRDVCRRRVAEGVAHALAHHRLHRDGEVLGHVLDVTGHPHHGGDVRIGGHLARGGPDAGREPAPAAGGVQVEDRGADVADDRVDLVHRLVHAARGVGDGQPGVRGLQTQPEREQPLQHVVVQIGGDAFAVGDDVELAARPLGLGVAQDQGRLVGERGQDRQAFVADRLRPVVRARDDEHAAHLLAAPHRHREPGPLPTDLRTQHELLDDLGCAGDPDGAEHGAPHRQPAPRRVTPVQADGDGHPHRDLVVCPSCAAGW